MSQCWSGDVLRFLLKGVGLEVSRSCGFVVVQTKQKILILYAGNERGESRAEYQQIKDLSASFPAMELNKHYRV